MSLLSKVLIRGVGDGGERLDSVERCFQDLVEPTIMQIATSGRDGSWHRLNYVDTAIGEASVVGGLRDLLSNRAKCVIGPFPERIDCEEGMVSPLLGLENSQQVVYGVVHKNGGSWRFNAATAEAAAAPQFYGNLVYQFKPELGFFGMSTDDILTTLIQQNGDGADIVRDVRSLIGLANRVLKTRIGVAEEIDSLKRIAVLVGRIGATARAVLIDLENVSLQDN